jgi:hypothetical protein
MYTAFVRLRHYLFIARPYSLAMEEYKYPLPLGE